MMSEGDPSPRIGRRRVLQIMAAAGVAGGLYGLGLMRGGGQIHTVREGRVLMGTQINLILHGPDADRCRQAVQDAFARMASLSGILSRHDQSSELAQLNRDGQLATTSPALRTVLDLAENISRSTDGAFDVTVLPMLALYGRDRLPERQQLEAALALVDYRRIERQGTGLVLTRPGMGITLDGIAKGYIVDEAVATLRAAGFANVYVEAGGDLMVTGAKPAHEPWRIGIRQPRETSGPMTVLSSAAALAVATSGDYLQAFTIDLRHHHILDPRTGMSPPELASATVTAPTVALADGLATAAMVLGPERAITALTRFPGCEGLFVGKDLRQYKTSGFAA